MAYYHDLVTQKSWEELKKLNKNIDFILIGGWAVYLYANTLKSKDIDIIVNFDQLPIIGKHYLLSKNMRLSKYEAVKDEVQIDIYLPHFSELGMPVEDLLNHKNHQKGFQLLDVNFLFILKMYTLSQRGRSLKGRKDLLDMLSLIISGQTDDKQIRLILEKYNLSGKQKLFLELVKENDRMPELNLNKHQFAKVKYDILEKFAH